MFCEPHSEKNGSELLDTALIEQVQQTDWGSPKVVGKQLLVP